AGRMRRNALEMALVVGPGSTHFGGGMSMVEITATLYGQIMNLDPADPEWADRDRFILSKGHSVLGYYTALAEVGYISQEELLQYGQHGSFLHGHAIMNREKGIEFSNGSLGMGLALGIGVAVAGKKREKNYRVYVLLGDGECNEGSVWEAAMAAPNYKLNNLVAIIDRNNFQQTGSNQDIMSLGDAAAKWRAFSWETIEVDGHNVGEMYDVLSQERSDEKPLAIIAHTIKGKGFSFSENNNEWHHAALSKDHYETGLQEISE
ncbi:uncharacterized protein METZ01_LOCUS438428, partial [marine metagenome]